MTNKISIITIVKNGMPYLKDSINSFESQSHENKEHIIIVSPSTDETEKFLKSNNLKNAKIFFNNEIKGRYEAINYGIKKLYTYIDSPNHCFNQMVILILFF